MFYRLAADLLVTVHIAYVAFVIFGFVLVLAGILFRWRWIRNVYFRLIHLLSILIVAGEALLGITCPLTIWEKDLRRLAGEAAYQGDFLANWIHDLLFIEAEPWLFTAAYTSFALLVVLTFIVAPPRWRSAKRF